MPRYRSLKLSREVFSEKDTADVLRVWALGRISSGTDPEEEPDPSHIARLVDIIGCSSGVRHEGRQAARQTMMNMLGSLSARQTLYAAYEEGAEERIAAAQVLIDRIRIDGRER